MTIDTDERESLHVMLDYLLNTREKLEKIDLNKLDEGIELYWQYSLPRHEFFNNASNFLRKVLGPKLRSAELALLFSMQLHEDTRNTDVPAIIANSLRSFLPLFMERAKHEGETFGDEKIEKVIDDLMGIYWGDEPRFFATAKKQQGSHKRPYRQARLRLAALNWDKYLAAAGLPAFERHAIIVEAFRADWDTIRKWAKPIEELFGLKSYAPYFPEHAKVEYAENPSGVREAIQRDGDAYWQEKSTAASGKGS